MKLTDGERPLGSYPSTALRGGEQGTLTSHRLVWWRDGREEQYPLDKISGVTLGYRRGGRQITWAVLLLVFALILAAGLIWLQSNLPAVTESMVRTLADQETPERIAAARQAYQQRMDALMLLILPLWGLAGAAGLYALWLGYTGLLGETRIEISVLATTRTLARRGRDPQLLAFGERVAQRAAGLEPHTETAPAADPQLSDWIPSR